MQAEWERQRDYPRKNEQWQRRALDTTGRRRNSRVPRLIVEDLASARQSRLGARIARIGMFGSERMGLTSSRKSQPRSVVISAIANGRSLTSTVWLVEVPVVGKGARVRHRRGLEKGRKDAGVEARRPCRDIVSSRSQAFTGWWLAQMSSRISRRRRVKRSPRSRQIRSAVAMASAMHASWSCPLRGKPWMTLPGMARHSLLLRPSHVTT